MDRLPARPRAPLPRLRHRRGASRGSAAVRGARAAARLRGHRGHHGPCRLASRHCGSGPGRCRLARGVGSRAARVRCAAPPPTLAGRSAPQAVLVVYGAPILATGEATFAGYITLDDTRPGSRSTDRTLERGQQPRRGSRPRATRRRSRTTSRRYPFGALLPLGIGGAAHRRGRGLGVPALPRLPRGAARPLALRARAAARRRAMGGVLCRVRRRASRPCCSPTRSGAE